MVPDMKLLAKFNLILAVVFGAGGLLIAHFAYSALIGNARREVLDEARLMLASERSVRDYVAGEVSPLLQENPRHRVRFLPQTIPFYAATATFRLLREHYPDYSYKEAALNPTNPEDRASDWEADIIHHLRDHPELKEVNSERETPMGRTLYAAQPIKVTPECLECHSLPSMAPAALRAVYGSANGFGWKNEEIIGAQIVAVPMSVPLELANRAYTTLLLFLCITMALAIVALDAAVYWFVIRPLHRVSEMANRVSHGEKNVPPVQVRGKDEIATVAASFNRMQVSLAKALKLISEG
jgi:HAMP domain-containing protein